MRPEEAKRLVKATAVVTVTLRMEVPDTWGSECTLDQVMEQASRAAIGMLRQALVVDDLTTVPRDRARPLHRVQIVGEPKVQTCLVEER